MTQLLYIGFGWLLGLLSPLIVDHFKSKKQTKEFLETTHVELRDLRYRLAISSFLLELSHGHLTVEFVKWIKPIIDNYEGDEPKEHIKKWIAKSIKDDQETLDKWMEVTRAKEGVGAGLKKFQPSYLLSNLDEISKLSPTLQRRFHEFFNHLHYLNEEIQEVRARAIMTFDASMTEQNYKILTTEIKTKYVLIAKACRRVADKIEAIVA